MKKYILHWEYSDKSASGIYPVLLTQEQQTLLQNVLTQEWCMHGMVLSFQEVKTTKELGVS